MSTISSRNKTYTCTNVSVCSVDTLNFFFLPVNIFYVSYYYDISYLADSHFQIHYGYAQWRRYNFFLGGGCRVGLARVGGPGFLSGPLPYYSSWAHRCKYSLLKGGLKTKLPCKACFYPFKTKENLKL